ncbi:hypothetical protein [Micromonospora sp. NPDC000442]|uniref:hypothetical protein n=1 Tax=Micromonospora sp. NPDC000442 TaxID=3364217 RepID=UPI0036AB288B
MMADATVGASPTPSDPSAALNSAAPSSSDWLEIFKRNIRIAHDACGGCGGQQQVNLPPAERAAAIEEMIKDSKPDFQLTKTNADLALRGPEGTVPKVAGPGGAGADVTFVHPDGTGTFRREVKCTDGPNFQKVLTRAAKQVKYDGEIFVQVPASVRVDGMIKGFWGARTDEQLLKFRHVWVVVHDPSGKRVAAAMLGLRGMVF